MPEAASPTPGRLGPASGPSEWWLLGGAVPTAGGKAASGAWPSLPGPGWPSKPTIEYLTKLIILLLLLLALPQLLHHVMTPKGSSAAAALGGAAAV